MIKKYVYGTPIRHRVRCGTTAGIGWGPIIRNHHYRKGICLFLYHGADDIVYGLGEANRGYQQTGLSLHQQLYRRQHAHRGKGFPYAAHNFILVSNTVRSFGMYFDYPSVITFDIGYTKSDLMTVTCDEADLTLYVIDGKDPLDIVKQFRKIIGRSYIPPKFAFGFGQSRWAIRQQRISVSGETIQRNHIPMDMLYMDIDYMESFKDFTVNKENFPDFKAFVMK